MTGTPLAPIRTREIGARCRTRDSGKTDTDLVAVSASPRTRARLRPFACGLDDTFSAATAGEPVAARPRPRHPDRPPPAPAPAPSPAPPPVDRPLEPSPRPLLPRCRRTLVSAGRRRTLPAAPCTRPSRGYRPDTDPASVAGTVRPPCTRTATFRPCCQMLSLTLTRDLSLG